LAGSDAAWGGLGVESCCGGPDAQAETVATAIKEYTIRIKLYCSRAWFKHWNVGTCALT
jgi:hypothetical protein